MSKYSKMVEKNKQESKERVARAIRVIREMSENGEQLVVCDLVKKTGYSRTFFYKNQECEGLVRMFLRFRFCGIVCCVLYRFPFPQSDL